MIAFLEGDFIPKSPTHLIINVNGVGYDVNISLNTYNKIKDLAKGRLLTFLKVSEDAHTLYGFYDEAERALFLQLISVSGVGATTARVMLSGMQASEIIQVIGSGNEKQLQAVKGIGAKTAQRIILELRDKVGKIESFDTVLTGANKPSVQVDALNALVSLGIAKNTANDAVTKALQSNPDINEVQQLIKEALKNI
jgi:holliday junction DNA helicase RuvA